jgi:hypothetical protein
MGELPATPPKDSIVRHVVIACGLALALYVIGFWGAQYLRERKGAWVVEFATDPSGRPSLAVFQESLGVRGVRLVFPDARIEPMPAVQRVVFDAPDKASALPFGAVTFLDTTFLPGTVTLGLFGHEVELLPRVLIIDKQEHVWARELKLEVRGRGVGGDSDGVP